MKRRFFVPGASTNDSVLEFVRSNPGCTVATIERRVATHWRNGTERLVRAVNALVASGAIEIKQRPRLVYSCAPGKPAPEILGYDNTLYVVDTAAVTQ